MDSAYFEKISARISDLENQLSSPDIFDDKNRYKDVSKEHSRLCEIRDLYLSIKKIEKEIEDSKKILEESSNDELHDLVKDELVYLESKHSSLLNNLEMLLVPPDPTDDMDVIIELRAGTGGDEAALFVADCVRMYQLYADKRKWKIEVLSATESDLGGFKEFIFTMSGKSVYRYMKHECGTHRVQRVPTTESQGRVHTSAITIAVMLDSGDLDDIEIDEKDLRIQTCRSSGAGGQHVNKTDSAVRITHIPSGIVCYCQEERSQLRNREKAMKLLKARLSDLERKKRHDEISSLRSSQIGSGDRSERIRTYNFPQNRVTDHRIGLTLYCLDSVMNGDLDCICDVLVKKSYSRQNE